MLGVASVLVAGNHGTEWLEPGSDASVAALDVAAIRARLDEVLVRLPELPGVPVEDKGLSASIHYRNAPDPDAARTAILEALGDVAPAGLDLRHGRMSVELRPTGAGDKGTAVRAIVERFGLRGVVVMGDDVTDLDMFRAVTDLREAGTIRAAVIGVGGGGGEVPAEVAATADVVLADPAEVAALLIVLAEDWG
jgi:trehalose 6-phosphate phosphatase